MQLTLGAEVMALAQAQWRPLGYLDVEDYLTGVLNAAMLEEVDVPRGEALADFDEDEGPPL